MNDKIFIQYWEEYLISESNPQPGSHVISHYSEKSANGLEAVHQNLISLF